jgi:hypothetical protein
MAGFRSRPRGICDCQEPSGNAHASKPNADSPSELMTEIGRVSSTSATAREILSLRADKADERLTRSERGSVGLSAEVEELRRRSDEAHEKIEAHKDDMSKIKKDLKQLKDRVDQQSPPPTPAAEPVRVCHHSRAALDSHLRMISV